MTGTEFFTVMMLFLLINGVLTTAKFVQTQRMAKKYLAERKAEESSAELPGSERQG